VCFLQDMVSPVRYMLETFWLPAFKQNNMKYIRSLALPQADGDVIFGQYVDKPDAAQCVVS
jgi:hypothetical protein